MALTGPEIRTAHAALVLTTDALAIFGDDQPDKLARLQRLFADTDVDAVYLLALALRTEVKDGLSLDHAGVRRWLAELPPGLPVIRRNPKEAR